MKTKVEDLHRDDDFDLFSPSQLTRPQIFSDLKKFELEQVLNVSVRGCRTRQPSFVAIWLPRNCLALAILKVGTSLMEQEQRFLAALTEVQRWDFNDIGQLQLWPASGKPIRLWPQ